MILITKLEIKNVSLSFLFKSILFGVLFSSLVISAQRTPPQNYNVLLSDDFEGTTLNESYWTKGLYGANGTKLFPNPNTGGRNKLNENYAGYILDSNTVLNNGILELHNKKEVVVGNDPEGIYNFSNAWINGLGKIKFNGSNKSIIIKIRMKLPSPEKDDVWPAVWLVEQNDWPAEIDIWEYFGKFFRTNRYDEMYFRYIYGVWNDNHNDSYVLPNFQATYNASAQHRIYGFKWTKDDMKWYIDGELVHTKTKGVEVPEADWPDQPMCMVINNGLLSVVDEGNTAFPNHLILDYFKVYEKN